MTEERCGVQIGRGRNSCSTRTVQGKSEKGRRARLLVVDDSDDNRAMYAEYLSFSGYEVEQASDGREAIEAAIRTLPDLIVMDLSLPVMDGWEATRRLKADERTGHIPVIVLSGHAHSRDAKGAEGAGVDAFLAKPCLPETLLEKVEELLRSR
jgi:two-component system cell cycle response regulator DivK